MKMATIFIGIVLQGTTNTRRFFQEIRTSFVLHVVFSITPDALDEV